MIFVLTVSSAIILFGIAMTYYAIRNLLEGCQAVNWKQAAGTILSAHSEDVNFSSRHGSKPEERQTSVRYGYEVGGHLYTSTRIHPTYDASRYQKEHRALERMLVPGTRVRVYYRDDDPATSTLATGFYSSGLFNVGFGFVLIACGLILLAWFWLSKYANSDYAAGISLLS